MKVIKTTGGTSIKVDDEDYDILKQYTWYKYEDELVKMKLDRVIVYMHNVIVGCPLRGFEVHHKNTDRRDNQRGNLEVITISMHRRKHRRVGRFSRPYEWGI